MGAGEGADQPWILVGTLSEQTSLRKKRGLLSLSLLVELCTSNHPLFLKNCDGRGQSLTCSAVAKARTCRNVILGNGRISLLYFGDIH